MLSESVCKCRFWPVTSFPNSGRNCWWLSSETGGVMGGQIQAHNTKGGCCRSHSARQGGTDQRSFWGYMFPYPPSFPAFHLPFLSLLPSHLNKPQNSGLPGRQLGVQPGDEEETGRSPCYFTPSTPSSLSELAGRVVPQPSSTSC